MTTTNLPATFDAKFDRSALNAATGLAKDSFKPDFENTFKINYDAFDEETNSIPVGTFLVKSKDKLVYAKEVEFKILDAPYQYAHFDVDNNKMVAKSVIEYSSFGEFPDDAGGFKCGKLKKKDLEFLDEAGVKTQGNIKLNTILRGVVLKAEGVDASGKAVTLKNVPAVFYIRGGSFMSTQDYLNEFQGKNYVGDWITKFSTKVVKEKGKKEYFNLILTKGTKSPLTEDEWNTLRGYQAITEELNTAIMKKHEAAKNGQYATPNYAEEEVDPNSEDLWEEEEVEQEVLPPIKKKAGKKAN